MNKLIILFWRRQIIDAYGVGKVIDSKDPRFQKDDLVVGFLSWAQYTVVENAQYLQRLDSTEFPLSYHLGVLGNLNFYIIFLRHNLGIFNR